MKSFMSERRSRPPLSRMLMIHNMLREGVHPNRRRMAQKLDTSEKTIQRDLDFMRDQMGLPIEYDEVKYGYYYREPVHQFPAFNISEGEIIALFLAQKALTLYKGTTFEKPLQIAFSKLTRGLKDIVSHPMGDFDRAFSFQAHKVATVDPSSFEAISHGILQSKEMLFSYHKLGMPHQRRVRVQPYHLRFIQDEWYLFGYDVDCKAIRAFALPRMKDVVETHVAFKKVESFSIEQYLAHSFGISHSSGSYTVKVWFDLYVAQMVRERIWHPSQEIQELPDGSLKLTMTLGSLTEVKGWILSYGKHARVLGPIELIQSIEQEVRAIARYYLEPDSLAELTQKNKKRSKKGERG